MQIHCQSLSSLVGFTFPVSSCVPLIKTSKAICGWQQLSQLLWIFYYSFHWEILVCQNNTKMLWRILGQIFSVRTKPQVSETHWPLSSQIPLWLSLFGKYHADVQLCFLGLQPFTSQVRTCPTGQQQLLCSRSLISLWRLSKNHSLASHLDGRKW